MKNLLYCCCIFLGMSAIAQTQQGVFSPHGMTFPRVSLATTSDVSTLPSPTVSQLIYNTNATLTGTGADGAGFYYWDGSVWKKLAVGPVAMGGGLPATGVVLSETEINTNLANNGFSLLGKSSLNYQAYTPADPAVTWQSATATAGAPLRTDGASVVWTGSKLIVWGGRTVNPYNPSNITYYNSGDIYDPVLNLWTPMQVSPATPSARINATAVWTGSLLIVYGGNSGSANLSDGALYNPDVNQWAGISLTGAPSARSGASVVWTGTEMLVWGGTNCCPSVYLNDGYRYSPTANAWAAMNTANVPAGRYDAATVWTGNELLVWGGKSNCCSSNFTDGAKYNPTTDTWTAFPATNAPSVRDRYVSCGTGSKWLIWGGINQSTSQQLNDGSLYDVASNTWTAVTAAGAPAARTDAPSVSTGTKIIVWGGADLNSGYLNTGGIFDPATNTWDAATSLVNAPTARFGYRPVWTGSRWIIWGGGLNSASVSTGAAFNPATNTWGGISTENSPAGRHNYAAFWDTINNRMVMWGGVINSPSSSPVPTNTGGLTGTGNYQTAAGQTFYLYKKN